VTYLYIILGAAGGAPLRYWLQMRVQETSSTLFPVGTIVVNITGCLVMGLLAALAEEHDLLNRDARLLLMVGFLGSYTTFSSFGLDTFHLLRDGEVGQALANMFISNAAGLIAVWVGFLIIRAIYRVGA